MIPRILVLIALLFSASAALATNVCGDISGVWDSTGSPYYVNCDVTVPAGQTLEIRPGVQVLFTGHYKFNVFGNLQAIGTAQDSIVFTRAFPTEESKWAGIRVTSGLDTCTFEFCRIEYGKATGGIPDFLGGGMLIDNRPFIVTHTAFENNYAGDDGGAVRVGSPYGMFTECTFKNNYAAAADGPFACGALTIHSSGVTVDGCLFANNHSQDRGGGVLFSVYSLASSSVVKNCTFLGNSALDGSAVAVCCGTSATLVNCIVINNAGGQQVTAEAGSVLSISYSDIQGGYPGIGNIDADPLFIDAANGDFHLQANSPCIDAGDPNSTLDPDGTIADMGAFYFYQSPPCLPTPLPFIDNFDLPELDSCWTWIREDSSHWSLTERPGWMRIISDGDLHWGSNDARNLLLRELQDADFVLECKVEISPTLCSGAALLIYADDANFLDLSRQFEGVRFHSEAADQVVYYTMPFDSPITFLRVAKIGNVYSGYFRSDTTPWTHIGDFERILSIDTQLKCGLLTGECPPSSNVISDFDYFRAYPLPLTATPTALAFGLLDQGTDSTRALSLTNPSGIDIPLTSLSFVGNAFSFDTTGLNGAVAAHTTFALPVTFAPLTSGTFADTLTIIAQQPGDSVIRIPLTGEAQILLPPVDSLVVQRGPQNGTLLNWAPVTHTISGQPFTPPYYIIYGATAPDGPFTPFGVAPTTSYHHPFIVSAQAKYFYQVTAASE